MASVPLFITVACCAPARRAAGQVGQQWGGCNVVPAPWQAKTGSWASFGLLYPLHATGVGLLEQERPTVSVLGVCILVDHMRDV